MGNALPAADQASAGRFTTVPALQLIACKSELTNRKSKIPQRGFTLLELLAVIAIIGILATLGTRGYSAAKRRAKIGRAQADLEHLRNALEEFRADYGFYPEQSFEGSIRNLDVKQLDDLTNAVATLSLEDPWGNDYWYFRAAGMENRFLYELWSTGEDLDDELDDIK